MEDIGNIIYYIVIFVIAIVSWLSSSTKKKSQQQTNIPSPFPEHEILATPPPVPKVRRKSTPPPPPDRLHTKTNIYSDLSSKYKEISPIQLEEEPSLIEELDLTDTESFRKAVIYTEILNRKY